MNIIKYHKLVRDRIPEIIESAGKTCICTELPNDTYIAMLDAKLNEELAEYQESKSLEELADLLEVMQATVIARGYTADFLTKKQVINRGVLPQYYVEGDHEAIISPETFELVQQEIMRRQQKGGRYSGVDHFASRIVCGECGSYYGAKVWHSNSKYRRVVYRYNRKYHDGKTCETPHVTENEIMQWFVSALNKLLDCKTEVIANLEAMSRVLFDTTELEKESARIQSEIEMVEEMIQRAIAENARIAQDQQAGAW